MVKPLAGRTEPAGKSQLRTYGHGNTGIDRICRTRTPEVRAVYDDIMATRQTDYINNFWKALAHDPATLRRTWESIKQIMAPGALDPLTKEMIYLAVSRQQPVRLLHRLAHRGGAEGGNDGRAVRRTDGRGRHGE